MREDKDPNYRLYKEYVALPTALPRMDGYDAENVYVIDLDAEVLTMNFTVHWRLNNIPREDNRWMHAIRSSNYRYVHTIDPDRCPEEHMASLAVELRDKDGTLGTSSFRTCKPHTQLDDARHKIMLAVVASEILANYSSEIVRFGRQWRADAFPFRELTFAVVSAAAGVSSFHSFAAQICNPRSCMYFGCKSPHLGKSPGWLEEDFAGDKAPLLEFGAMAHKPGAPAGAAPVDTMYWITEDVLVSPVLVVDGKAITEAMDWGLEETENWEETWEEEETGEEDGKKRPHSHAFYMVVLSLFEVILAEVSWPDCAVGEPTIRLNKSLRLSPLRKDLCFSTHPRERPIRDPSGQPWGLPHTYMAMRSYRRSVQQTQDDFPGIAAMVNFFDTVASRRAAAGGSSIGRLPPELYTRILDYVDYDTWKTCLVVSSGIRALCLSKYRMDDRTAIVGGPITKPHPYRGEPLLVFDFENLQTGKRAPAMRTRGDQTDVYNWMPVIGSDRKTLMADVTIQFEPPLEPEKKKDSAVGAS